MKPADEILSAFLYGLIVNFSLLSILQKEPVFNRYINAVR